MELTITRAKKTIPSEKKLRVCAYCRVSTDKTDQWNSLESQKKFFETEFERNPDWVPCGVYADEGISGTTLEKRDAFNEMIRRAKEGEIDLIVTKEVSRFSRNLVDTITIVNDLAKRGVYVYFLSDRINTAVPEERDRLDQLALYAQQESKRTSTRVRWGQSRCMERGVVFGRKEMYGYNIRREGKGKQTFEIIEEEAETVRKIFGWYAEGDGTHVIAKRLEQMGVKSKYKNGWSNTVILRILRQEKYVGDLVQGKTYTPDPMSHKKQYNRGESDSYYIKDHHPEAAIIDRGLWDRVQALLEQNSPSDEVKAKHNNRYWLSGKVFCGICDSRYVSFTKQLTNTQYKAWICFANHERGKRKTVTNDLGESVTVGCDAKRVNEKVLTLALHDILTVFLRRAKDGLVDEILGSVKKLQSGKSNEKQLQKLQSDLDRLNERKSRLLDVLLDGVITKDEYEKKHKELCEKTDEIQDKIKEYKSDDKVKSETAALYEFKRSVEEMAALKDEEINEQLYARVTEKIIVHPENVLEFRLRFYPAPIFLQYRTTGKGENFDAEFTVIT
jgi:DNA invertase Pin-like site-specific DNA recombinase